MRLEDIPAKFIPKTADGLPPGMYLMLYHGRKHPDEEMEDWGFDGPILGPLKYGHITYRTTLQLGFVDGFETGPEFAFDGDCLKFGDAYYGDWSFFIVPAVADGRTD